MKTLEQVRRGLDASEFFLEYMPTMRLADERCIGAECLIRWQHGDEIVPPLEFIPAIEKTPFAGFITCWIIEIIGKELGDWLRANPVVHVGINVAPELIGRGGQLYAVVKAGLMEVKHQLIMEITERGLPDMIAIDALVKHGDEMPIAVDDFGTGDLNLAQLAKIPARIIKIDKSFVDEIKPDRPLPKMVVGLTAFAHAIGVELIAEGVESAHQARALKDLGVDMAQGWHYSKPRRRDAFLEFFEQHHP